MIVMARFTTSVALQNAARKAHDAGHRPLEAFTPIPVPGLADMLHRADNKVRVAMAVGGFAVATMAYALEWYSAVIAYPIDSGGRPLHSWPAFVFFPFSIGILAAAVAGLIAFCFQAGLPSLHHPVFALRGIACASQDAFVLVLAPSQPMTTKSLCDLLKRIGADEIWEAEL